MTVTVKTDSGQYIGFTVFTYKDDVKEMVKNIVNDDTLQFEFFKEYARELEKKTRWGQTTPRMCDKNVGFLVNPQ